MSSPFEIRSELARYRSIGQRKVRSVTKFVPQTCRQSAWHGKLPESAPASIDHLTSSELRAVVIELRPPDIRDLMEYDHEVLAARRARDMLLDLLRTARLKRARVDRQLDGWRFTHPVQARLDELGLMSFEFSDRWKAIKEALEKEIRKLTVRVDQAQEHARNVERTVQARIIREQAPLREYIADLERLERQKIMQELVERWQTHEFDNALTVFKMLALKREMKAFGYDDAGVRWEMLPQSLRKAIDNFNRLPREARSVALDRMKSGIELNPEDARRLMREMGMDWE